MIATALVSCLGLGALVGRALAPARAPRSVVVLPVPSPGPAPAPSPGPAPAPAPAPVLPAADAPQIHRGTCATGLLPPGDVPSVSDDDATALVDQLAAWLARPDEPGPRIAYARGVRFVESEEDRGDDPPYPRSAAPERQRVCGTAATWLRDALRARLARIADARGDGLTCDGAVCCYDGMEYAPDGLIVFRPVTRDGATVWTLDAWAQVYTRSLSDDVAVRNEGYVRSSLRRLAATSCPGEPADLTD